MSPDYTSLATFRLENVSRVMGQMSLRVVHLETAARIFVAACVKNIFFAFVFYFLGGRTKHL